jgi:hypothetical protein
MNINMAENLAYSIQKSTNGLTLNWFIKDRFWVKNRVFLKSIQKYYYLKTQDLK